MFGSAEEFNDQTFERLDLRGVTVTGKEFSECTFLAVQAAEAKFVRCRFVGCTFKDSDFSNAKLTSTTVRGLVAEDSKLLGINWTEAAAASDLSFQRCVLTYSNFSALTVRSLRLRQCVAREVEFAHADLSGAVFTGTDFAGARFHQTKLAKADFREAHSYVIRPLDNVVKGAKFSLPEATTLLYGLDIELSE